MVFKSADIPLLKKKNKNTEFSTDDIMGKAMLF